MKILKNSYVKSTDKNEPGKVIKKIMEKENGNNIINFSNYVEEQIDQDCLNILKNKMIKSD